MKLPCATHLVVLARYQGERLRSWIEGQLEGWLGLQINREKTKTVQLKQEGVTLSFLGYTFGYALDLHGRGHRYLTLYPSAKAMEREREKIRDMTSAKRSYVPARHLIEALNAHLKGWKGYYKMGLCRRQFRQLNYYVGMRVLRHLQRRSQRGYKRRANLSGYAYLQHSDYNSYEPIRTKPMSAMKRVQESRIVETSMYGLTRGAG